MEELEGKNEWRKRMSGGNRGKEWVEEKNEWRKKMSGGSGGKE